MWCRSCRTLETFNYLNVLPSNDLSNTEQYQSDSAAFVIVMSRFWGGAQPSGKQHAAWQYLLYNFYVPWFRSKIIMFHLERWQNCAKHFLIPSLLPFGSNRASELFLILSSSSTWKATLISSSTRKSFQLRLRLMRSLARWQKQSNTKMTTS
jgi:hypothetical protein